MSFFKKIISGKKIVFLGVVLFINLILISSRIVLQNEKSLFQNTISLVISPFQIGIQKTVDFLIHEVKHYIFLKNIFEKYHQIKKKYSKLKVENYLLKKKINHFSFSTKAETIAENFQTAEVVSLDNNFPLNNVLINKGSFNGIKRNMIALNIDGELVGRVIEPISPFSAKVRLITSSLSGLGAYVKNNLHEGFLSGKNSQICEYKYLIKNIPVYIDNEIITSGTDRIFPAYLPVGKVIKIEKEYLVQKIYVRPFFVEKSFKQLIIIKNDDIE